MAIDAVARSLIKSDMDATGFVRGAEQMAAAADKASTATERLTTQTERTKRTASESGGAFERLRAKYDEAFAAVKPVFKKWASLVVRAGEPGAGTRMKLARNMLTFIGFAASCEAMALAEAAGIDLQKLGRVVRHSDAQSGGPGAIILRDDTAPLAPDHWLYDMFVHTRGLAEKDLSLALGLGNSVGVDLPLARVALDNLAAGLGVPHEKE